MTSETNVLELSESECADRLRQLWLDADVHVHWPADTATANELLRAGGYDSTVELLETWARSQQVGLVKIHGGRFSWSPSNILRAAALANASRRWIPLHSKQIHKMTAPELAEAQAAAVGETIFTDLESVDIRSLVGVIQNTADAELRSVLCVGLLSKLKQAGIQ